MKRTLTYNMVWMLLAIMAFASCTNDDQLVAPELPASTPRLSIGVSTVKQDADTRATIYTTSVGVTALNENRINKLDIYLYKMEGGNIPTAQSVKHITISNIDENSVYTIPMQPLTITELKALLGENNVVVGAQCYAYVIANAPASISGSMSGNRTIYELQSIELPATTHTFYNNAKQDNLVMDGSNAVTLRLLNDTYTLTGDINLNRAASKMDLVITEIKSPVVDDRTGNHWTPLTDQIYVGLYNGVKRGQINQDNLRNEDKVSLHLTNEDYFHFLASSSNYASSMRKMNQVQVGTDDEDNPIYNYEMDVPFYSYQLNWTNNQRHKPYYSLMVRWQRVEEDEDHNHPIVNTFYQIPVTTEFNYMNRNVYYRMEAVVSAIGSSLEEIPDITLEQNTFIALDWSGSDSPVRINLRELKYLSVLFNEWTLNNEKSGSVEYASSHNTHAEVMKVEYMDYTQTTSRKYEYEMYYYNNNQKRYRLITTSYNANGTTSSNTTNYNNGNTFNGQAAPFVLSTANNNLTLTQNLDFTDVYTPRIVTVRIWNDVDLEEYVTFTIYPPIYLTGAVSAGKVYINTYTAGNTAWNSAGTTSTTNHRIGNVTNGLSGNLTNGNHYIVTTSALSTDKYTIGDPRVPQGGPFTNIVALTDYRPTQTTGTENMISPEFMVASAYGATGSNYYYSWDRAQERCASYQEDGYPAGRWRMPTAAEISYIIDLQNEGVIPSLFAMTYPNDTEGYWSANGKVVTQNNVIGLNTNYNNINTAVRCVYDTWYWGTEHATGNAANKAIKGDNMTSEELAAANWTNNWIAR